MKKAFLFALGAAVLAAPAVLAPASAQAASACSSAPPSGVIRICTGDGDTLRARLWEHANFTGGRIDIFGGGPCTATTSDADYTMSKMPNGWNDKVSAIKDYNNCDVKLYVNGPLVDDPNDATDVTPYINYGAGKYVGDRYNDKMSSLRLS